MNIVTLTHCATRLRPTLRDRSAVVVDAIRQTQGVRGVVDNDSSFQIVISTNVSDDIIAASSLRREDELDVDEGNLELLTPRFVCR